MPTLPNMGLITPTLGGDSGVWDDKINAAFGLVDAHDHTSGKGVAVPVAGLNINADLPLAGFSISNAGKVTFSPITTPSSGSKYLFVDSADNELYWRNNGGSNVKVTSGGTLNISVVGGIVGDYSSVGAEVAYDDANDTYTFKQQGSPKPWARIETGPVRIYEYNTTETVYIEQAVAAALAASYTVTWPATLPAHDVPLQISPAGVLSFSDTFSTSTVFTAGDFKNNTGLAMMVPATAAYNNGNADVFGALAKKGIQLTTGNACSFPCPIPANATMLGYSVQIIKNTNAATTVNARMYYADAANAETALGAGTSDNSNAGGAVSLAESFSTQITGLKQVYVAIWATGGGVTDVVCNVTYTYKRA